ncbi:MAG TPA: DUF3095 domain-containing protein [Stellaceae bacterium]|nr:DUF3095 domain-containing protein [Stellaceae bacterium]
MEPAASHPAGDFYASLPVFDGFDRIIDPLLYRPLPEDWGLGLADIVGSTEAIAAGGYKAVNMAGAAVISAVANALGTRQFPFVFGGDGASFAVAPDGVERARAALAAAIAYAREELALSLRAAMVPVASVRAAGLDARVARFAPSPNVTYAMFSGGGLAWAERAMKRGEFAVAPAAPGTRPDLAGLSCRFERIPAARGIILSLLAVPTGPDALPDYWELIARLLALAADRDAAGTPVTRASLRTTWPPSGLELEARSRHRPGRPLGLDRALVAAWTLISYLIFRWRVRIGGFSPQTYLTEVAANSDFRKYDDGLRMTLDCTAALAGRIEALLDGAARRGVVRFGLYRQDEALVTCFTPSVFGEHFHFVDGASGGYAAAAQQLGRLR